MKSGYYTWTLQMLDELDEVGAWVSMFEKTRRSHMDSYGTLPVYEKIDAWFEKNFAIATKEQWEYFIKYCEDFAYLSPNSSILGMIVKRKVENKMKEKQDVKS